MKGDSLFALIAGAAAGLTLGLLFAPEKGEDTRRKVMCTDNLKSTLQEQTADFTEEARARIVEKLDKLEKALRNDIAEAGTPEEQVQEEA